MKHTFLFFSLTVAFIVWVDTSSAEDPSTGDRYKKRIALLDQQWKPAFAPKKEWKACYGAFPNNALSVVGVQNGFAVLADGSNTSLVANLVNGTIFRNVTHPLNASDYASYQILSNGVLLQMDYATLTAWSLPDFVQLWSVLTFQLYQGGNVAFSSKGNFFCLWGWVYDSQLQTARAYPFCYRASDGSLLWTAAGNRSMGFNQFSIRPNSILVSEGVLVVAVETFFQTTLTISAIDVETGTYLWSESVSNAPNAQVVVAMNGVLVHSVGVPNGTQAVDIRTGRTVWSRLDLVPPASPSNVLAVDGVIVSNTTGAYFAANGSTLWTFSDDTSASVCAGGMTLSAAQHPHLDDVLFLCYSNSFATYTFVAGHLKTGRLSAPSEVTTPATLFPFGSDQDFFYLAAQPLTSSTSLYCLHSLSF